jgi:hypothetical protein
MEFVHILSYLLILLRTQNMLSHIHTHIHAHTHTHTPTGKGGIHIDWDEQDLEKGKMAPIPAACVAANLLEQRQPGKLYTYQRMHPHKHTRIHTPSFLLCVCVGGYSYVCVCTYMQTSLFICLSHATPHRTSLHFTALHYTALHCTTLHYTALHYTVLHYTVLHYTVLHRRVPGQCRDVCHLHPQHIKLKVRVHACVHVHVYAIF